MRLVYKNKEYIIDYNELSVFTRDKYDNLTKIGILTKESFMGNGLKILIDL